MPTVSKVLFLSVGSLWGAAFPLTRYLTAYVDALWMVLGRLALGSVVLFGVLQIASAGPIRGLGRRTAIHLAVAGLLNLAIPWCLMAIVLRTVPASIVAVFFAGVGPLLTFAVGVAIGRERWGVRRACGLVLSLLGVALISAGAASRAASPIHLVSLAIAVLAISVGAVYVSTHLRQVPATTVAFGQLVAATLVVAVTSLLSGRDVFVTTMTVGAWVVWATLGVASTALTYLLFFVLLQREGPVTASAANYITVVVGVGAGFAFLAEPMTWPLLFGGVLILVGMTQSTRRPTPIRSGSRPGTGGPGLNENTGGTHT